MFTHKTDSEASDFVHYGIFHSDSKAIIKFLNKNLELKSKFLAECSKGGSKPDMSYRESTKIPRGDPSTVDYLSDVPVKEYAKMFKDSIDSLY